MALNIDELSPAARERYRIIGEGFSSDDTLLQADRVLESNKLYGDKISERGFPEDDATRLADARTQLQQETVGREGSRTLKKKSAQEHAQAMRQGKDIRQRSRSILSAVSGKLLERTEPEAGEAVRTLQVTLDQTSSCGQDAELLRRQLEQLHAAFTLPMVSQEAARRGGAKAVSDLIACAARLDAVRKSKAVPRGTPAETERIDVLDGIIVVLARSARKAARVAARELGNAAIAKAFELVHLYGNSGAAETTTVPEAPAVEKTEP